MTDNPIIKQKEMAKRLGVTPRTLNNWDKQKILIARRTPTNRPFYTEKDYNDFIERGKSKAGD